ncbi:MAG: SMP-30/gluconolactonase/LRE family protein [Acidobacteriia bacterium]|nr:SMP-30/gluconolactonase/LRE family protein [Terriglobia bacterium]
MLEAKSEKFWKVVNRDAAIRQVCTGFAFTEGPVVSRRGFLLFSDIPNLKIMKWERGQLTALRENSNKANGLTFDHQGRLLAAEGGARVTRTEKNGTITVLAAEGLEGPNDLVYAIDGSIYFSDLPRSRVYQITRQRSGVGGAPPKGEVRLVAETPAPNGVALSPNQQQLYIADVKTSMVRVHQIAADGALDKGRDFAPLRVDGLKTDEMGNVWMASRDGIYVHAADGEHLGTIKTPEGPSNCCFGEGFRGLYITARKSVYHIPTLVPGTRTF